MPGRQAKIITPSMLRRMLSARHGRDEGHCAHETKSVSDKPLESQKRFRVDSADERQWLDTSHDSRRNSAQPIPRQ